MDTSLEIGSWLILVLTLMVSLLALYVAPALIGQTMLRPYWLVRKSEYWRLLTSGFVHASFGHLALNMISFCFFAFALERRIGTLDFLALYLVGMLLANLGTYFKHRNDPNYASLGASGAVLAVLFAAVVYFPRMSMYVMLIPVPIPAPLFAVGYLIYSYYQARQQRGHINHDAHIFGAVTGLAFVALTDPSAYRQLLAMLGR
ncbi:MAG: rhomboid family intramembrane serine protease [Steroidobacteraceae bacterium]|jgi:membrane associated rhomboid family serine protease